MSNYMRNIHNFMGDNTSDSDTDTNYSRNSYESNTEECYNGLSYENNNKNRIVLCEIFHPLIHGLNNKSDPNIMGHYLNIDSFNIDDFYPNEEDDESEINIVAELHNAKYEELFNTISNHSIIRNYSNMISASNYIKPEIGVCLILKGKETVVILKTFWLRLIQRTWKNVYKKKIEVIKRRRNINCIIYKQTIGKWQLDCRVMPTLYGMLSKLK